MTRRIRCKTSFNVTFRRQPIFTLVSGRAYLLPLLPISARFRTILGDSILRFAAMRMTIFTTWINLMERDHFQFMVCILWEVSRRNFRNFNGLVTYVIRASEVHLRSNNINVRISSGSQGVVSFSVCRSVYVIIFRSNGFRYLTRYMDSASTFFPRDNVCHSQLREWSTCNSATCLVVSSAWGTSIHAVGFCRITFFQFAFSYLSDAKRCPQIRA